MDKSIMTRFLNGLYIAENTKVEDRETDDVTEKCVEMGEIICAAKPIPSNNLSKKKLMTLFSLFGKKLQSLLRCLTIYRSLLFLSCR